MNHASPTAARRPALVAARLTRTRAGRVLFPAHRELHFPSPNKINLGSGTADCVAIPKSCATP